MFKKIISIVIILSISFTLSSVYAASHIPLTDSVLRLHVIANSDDPADQQLKLQVKDEIVAMMRQEFQEVEDSGQAEQISRAEIPRIEAVAARVIASRGYDYPVKVTVGEYPFPAKSYGNMVFPPGNYQAVRVVIGEGQGKNWWCVLFPPLCLVASSDRGISMKSSREARVSFKCLKLIPKGVKIKHLSDSEIDSSEIKKSSEVQKTKKAKKSKETKEIKKIKETKKTE